MMRRLFLAMFALTLVSSPASANAPEDMFGTSARVNGMGGAGTVTARDGFAAYYNPALLSRCPDNQLNFGIQRVNYGLHVRRTGADAPAEAPRTLDTSMRGSFGACLLLPYHLAAGFTVAAGMESLGRISLNTRRDQPTFPLYGRNLEHINFNAGLSFRPIRQISVGVGASVLVNGSLAIAIEVPLAVLKPDGTYDSVAFRIDSTLLPRAAPYFGILIEPSRRVRIGASFRGEIALNLTVPMSITATFLSFVVPVPMQLTADVWYSPKQFSIGAAVDITENLFVTGDATWYGYSDLATSSFPYLTVGPIPGSAGSILDVLGLAATDPPDYRSVWNFRAGVEGRVGGNRHLALRGGYSLRTSALPNPSTRNTTLLDGSVHSFTAGAGIAIHTAWDDSPDPRDDFSAHHDDSYDGEEPTLEGDADGAEAATRNRTQSHPVRISARADAFLRLSVMPGQHDSMKDIRWGGHIFDAGATFSLGWR